MSWQEALRKLDEELAAGQISADEYRTRRDQVLSLAVAPSGQEAKPNPSEATTTVRPVGTPPQPQGAEQPPPAPQPPRPAAADSGEADKTQVVPGQDADKTQVVGGWQAQRPPGDSDRTQVVPGVPPQSVAGGQAARPAPPPPWGQQEDLSPPWAGTDFPPLAATGTPDWIRQGPEVFDEGGRGKLVRVAAIALAVLVVGGLVFGAFWLWGRSGDDPSNTAGSTGASTSSSKPARTTRTTPPDPRPVAQLPGREERHAEVKTFADVPKLNYLNEAELKAYEAAAATDAKFAVRHLDSGSKAVFLLVKVAGADNAKSAATALRDVQTTNGAAPAATVPPGVLVTEIEAKAGAPAQIRAHYVHGDTVVRVEVWNSTGLAAAKSDFPGVIDAQLKVFTADA